MVTGSSDGSPDQQNQNNDTYIPYVVYLVKRVERGARAAIDEGLREFQLTTPQYTTLSVLRLRSGLSSAQLARCSFVSPQAMNQLVVGLERRGLLARTPDPAHRRVLSAVLTARGEQLLAACDRRVADIERMMLGTLNDSDIEALRGALQKCAAALEESHRTTQCPTFQETPPGP
jgi:DNA-binding MarR family transcriptional regulator